MVQTRSHYAQYFFLNKLMKIGLVLVLTPDWWRERPVGTSTNTGRKVLNSFSHYYLYIFMAHNTEDYTGKIIHINICTLIYSSVCVLNFLLPACRTNFAIVSHTTYNIE